MSKKKRLHSKPTSLRWAASLLALLGILPHLRLPDGPLLNLTGLKMFASPLAPLLGFISGMVGLHGWRKKDRLTGALGFIGGLLAWAHVARVTAPHTAFEQGLGIDWRKEIPLEVQRRWLPRRYTPPRLSPSDAPCQRNIMYAVHPETNAPLLADLWRPPESVRPSGLGIIYLHNSGWHYMDKDMLTRPWFRYLAHQGHVVMDAAYSLAPHNTGRSGNTPLQSMLADVERAILWFKTNAEQYGVDANRIVLMGASAGGHLALLSAYTSQPETSVCGVISLYGVSDLESAHRFFQRIPTADQFNGNVLRSLGALPPNGQLVGPSQFIPSLLGGLPSAEALRLHPGSPLNHIGPHCPPTLLIHGSHDFGVDISQSRSLYQALRCANIPAVFVELPETDHAFDLFFMEYAPAFQTAVYDVERFLSWLG